MAGSNFIRKSLYILSLCLTVRISWGVLMLCVIYLYLGFHALTGSQGLVSWANYKSELPKLSKQVEELQAKRIVLEQRAKRLNDKHISRDSLDKKARETLNVSHANDYVIWLDETP